MEEQTAALLAALKKQASTNVDQRLNLFGTLKSSIKHQRVPESCQAPILECIRIAITAQTSAALVTAGFSTLSHLAKRLQLQKETHIITTHASSLCPVLLDRLGDAREAHRNHSSMLLTELYPWCHTDIDAGIHDAIGGNNPRAKETAMTWVVKVCCRPAPQDTEQKLTSARATDEQEQRLAVQELRQPACRQPRRRGSRSAQRRQECDCVAVPVRGPTTKLAFGTIVLIVTQKRPFRREGQPQEAARCSQRAKSHRDLHHHTP
jgi:hypothetical protein